MAEEKKKRGRPPKKTQEVDINENKSTIRMNTNDTPTPSTPITINQVNSRLSSMFKRMSSNNVSYSSFLEAMNRMGSNFAFDSNPFLQNQ